MLPEQKIISICVPKRGKAQTMFFSPFSGRGCIKTIDSNNRRIVWNSPEYFDLKTEKGSRSLALIFTAAAAACKWIDIEVVTIGLYIIYKVYMYITNGGC